MRLFLRDNNLGLAGALVFLAVTAMPVKADYQATVLGQGPVGYWRLNETVQPPVGPIFATNIGSVGAAANGTYIPYILANRGVKPGAIVSEPGNGALGFDGLAHTTNRVRIPFQTQWNPTGPLSVEFWAKPAATNNFQCPAASVEFIEPPPPPAAQIPPSQRNGWLFYQGDSTLTNGSGWMFRQFNSSGLTNLTSASVDLRLDTNRWYHVVGTFDGTNISTYVNGVLGASAKLTGTVRATTNAAIPLTFRARADAPFPDYSYAGPLS